jgi:hypothetical protein
METEQPFENTASSSQEDALVSLGTALDEGHDEDDSALPAFPRSEDALNPTAQRKAAKKAQKAERRAQLEGRGDPTAGQKLCDMCGTSVNLLIRCMYEESPTEWKMVCGKKCWKVVSGGVADGDAAHPHYRYGGLWKNRRAQS